MYKGAIEVAVLSGLKLLTKNKQKWKKKSETQILHRIWFLIVATQSTHTHIHSERDI